MFNIPHLPFQDFPEAKSRESFTLYDTLSQLERFVSDFRASLLLYDTCTLRDSFLTDDKFADPLDRGSFRRWPFLAASYGALSLFNYKHARDAIPGQIKSLPSLVKHVDLVEIGKAGSDFTLAFPDWAGIRHTTAHAGEFASKPNERELHSTANVIKLPGFHIENAKSFVSGNLSDRTYFSTYDGRVVSYRLSRESLEVLTAVTHRVYNAVWAGLHILSG